jgi:hypothetical protein
VNARVLAERNNSKPTKYALMVSCWLDSKWTVKWIGRLAGISQDRENRCLSKVWSRGLDETRNFAPGRGRLDGIGDADDLGQVSRRANLYSSYLSRHHCVARHR